MEVLKSATTPNCATWTMFSGMTSLTQARSLSRCLNLQAICLLVSIDLPKCCALPHFREKNEHPIFRAVGFRSTNSCMQVHQALFQGKGIHFFTTGLRHNFSWWLGPWLIGQRSSLESFSWFQTVPYVCVSSKTAQNNVHSFVFQQSSVYNARLWSRRPIWVPSWSYCGTWSPFSTKAKVECRKTPVFWAARIILAKLMINRQIDLML